MTTEKTRNNNDYTASAVNLNNPLTVQEMLGVYLKTQAELEALQEEARKVIPAELSAAIAAASELLAVQKKTVQLSIDNFGSYQDIDNGHYAVKQRKVSEEYHVEPFKKLYPQYIPAVIVETINVKALEGLIKGKLLDRDELKNADIGIITENESFTYIIK